MPAGRQLVVNMTSASGSHTGVLGEGRAYAHNRHPQRGGERNAPRFAAHWTAALSSEQADVNRNGTVTAQEAFDYAARMVADEL